MSLCGNDTSLFAGKFEVRQMTTADCERMLVWLAPNFTFDLAGEDGLVTGKKMTVEQLGKLPLYGKFEKMEQWFESKNWNESVLC